MKTAVFFTVALVIIAALAFVAFVTPARIDQKVVIFSGGHTLAFCVSIDTEKRIAYDCNFSGTGHTDELHLSASDTWSVWK